MRGDTSPSLVPRTVAASGPSQDAGRESIIATSSRPSSGSLPLPLWHETLPARDGLERSARDTIPVPRWSGGVLEPIRAAVARTERAPAPTAWQVAGWCVGAIADALQARAVLVHQHVPRTGEVRIIGAHGPNTCDLLGDVIEVEDDFIATTVLSNERPMTVRFDDGEVPRVLPLRLRTLAAARSVVAVPVIGHAGCAAIIEVIDADEERFESAVQACETAGRALLRVLVPAT